MRMHQDRALVKIGLSISAAACFALLACSTAMAGEVTTDTAAADPAIYGDWQGKDKNGSPVVAQVIPYGGGKYGANLLTTLDERQKPFAVLEGKQEGDKVKFAGAGLQGTMEKQKLTLENSALSTSPAVLEKTVRLSPTLGAKPPEGAVVLFDGKNLDQWQKSDGKPAAWKLVDGAMEVTPKSGNIETKKTFKDAKYHIEFRTPLMATERGQKRGNSGVYLQGCYEVQVLDSYGLEGKDNECGGIYKVGAPRVNMCAPPLQWQTYDITFHAVRFDDKGQKTAPAQISVDHNGVSIHKDLAIPGPTGGAKQKDEPKNGGVLLLQEHAGDPVQYRNIWAVELPDQTK